MAFCSRKRPDNLAIDSFSGLFRRSLVGPFSFGLSQEMQMLEEQSYVENDHEQTTGLVQAVRVLVPTCRVPGASSSAIGSGQGASRPSLC
jgi:hypothetical protein